MIADISKITIKAYSYFLSIFRRQYFVMDNAPTEEEVRDMLVQLARKQKESREQLSKVSNEAADILQAYLIKEAEERKKFQEKNEALLESLGIDKDALEEFLKDPTLDKLNELKEKHPKTK